jgi:hypothetical protein
VVTSGNVATLGGLRMVPGSARPRRERQRKPRWRCVWVRAAAVLRHGGKSRDEEGEDG